MRSFYQDRLGTNTGKIETQSMTRFSSQAEQVAAEEATAAALARGEAPPVPAAEADAKALADAAVRLSHSLLPHAYSTHQVPPPPSSAQSWPLVESSQPNKPGSLTRATLNSFFSCALKASGTKAS